MRLLVLDAALACATAALLEGDRVLAVRSFTERTGLAVQLPLMLVEILAETGLRVEDCDGSFTGIRTALALAEGLARASGRKLAPVTVGEALHQALPHLGKRDLWTATLSRRGHVFIETDQTCLSLPLTELPRPAGPLAVAGNAAIEVTARLAARGHNVMLTDARHPSPRAIAAAARLRLEGGLPARSAAPLYVDPPEAKLPAGGLRPTPAPPP
jgi:tRNA A37 threonylcarbamoyladenosine modification protein TsaB